MSKETMTKLDKVAIKQLKEKLILASKAVILKGHGALVVGKSIEEAIFAAEHLETSAKLQWMARCVGNVVPLTEQEVQPLNEFQETWGRQPWMAADREWKYYEYLLKKGALAGSKPKR